MSGAILVTGADGFIGTHLVQALRAGGRSVFTHSLGDGDLAHCALPYDRVDHVFHLAGRSFVPESWKDVRGFCEANVLGTVNVLEFCRRQGASATCISSYVYGNPQALPVAETHPRSAANPYALSKIMAEDACFFYAGHMGVRVCVVRPFNIYGPGQREPFLIPAIAAQAIRPGADTITIADGRPKRDYLYISDLVDLLLAILERRAAGVFNAGSGEAVSVEELAAIVMSLSGPRQLIIRGEPRPYEILEVRADIGKARRELSWSPRTRLRSGLEQVIASMPRSGA